MKLYQSHLYYMGNIIKDAKHTSSKFISKYRSLLNTYTYLQLICRYMLNNEWIYINCYTGCIWLIFCILFSTMTWKSTSTLIPCASFIYTRYVFYFFMSDIFLRRSSLFYFRRSISSKHEVFFICYYCYCNYYAVVWRLFVPSFKHASFTY